MSEYGTVVVFRRKITWPADCIALLVDMGTRQSRHPSLKLGLQLKLFLCLTKYHSMKTYWGNGGIAPRILNLATRLRWVVSFVLRPLYPRGRSLHYPLDRRLGGPKAGLNAVTKRKNLYHCPYRELNPDRPARSLVCTLTELSRLRWVLGTKIYVMYQVMSLYPGPARLRRVDFATWWAEIHICLHWRNLSSSRF
jgi:hypothetical protein